MHFLPDYIVKLSVSLAVVYLFYYGILRKLTFYNHNRWYLAGYTLLSFLIPFINVSSVLQKNNWQQHDIINWVPVINPATVTVVPAALPTVWSIKEWIMATVILGILVMLARLLLQVFSFKKMLRKAEPVTTGNMNLYQVNENIIPFSFGNAIFINRDLHSESELQEIIRHEFVHVKQYHSLDIIWGEILCILNWYNPFAWLIKRSIRQNLEFIADNKVLENGINKKEYQYLLLKVIGNNQYSIANQFNFSSLKKRIAMMNKTKSAKRQLIRLLFLLPATAVLLLAFRSKWDAGNKTVTHDKTITKDNSVSVTGLVTGDQTLQPIAEANIVNPASQEYDSTPPRDTFPKINSKGYQLIVKGNNVVIKNRSGKVVKTVSLEEWESNEEKYENTYGELPPPPPPPAPPMPPAPPAAPGTPVAPLPPAAPAAPGMPDMPAPPVPPAPPAPPAPPKLPANVKRLSINNNKASIWLKNGQQENYDLNNAEEKEKFEKKYGKIPEPPTAPGNLPGQFDDEPVSMLLKNKIVPLGALAPSKPLPENMLYVLDGAISTKTAIENLGQEKVHVIRTLKPDAATALYGAKGNNGALLITTTTTGEVMVTSSATIIPNRSTVTVYAPDVDIRDSKKLILLDGKELAANKAKLTGMYSLLTLSKSAAEKKYGRRGGNGAVEITTLQ